MMDLSKSDNLSDIYRNRANLLLFVPDNTYCRSCIDLSSIIVTGIGVTSRIGCAACCLTISAVTIEGCSWNAGNAETVTRIGMRNEREKDDKSEYRGYISQHDYNEYISSSLIDIIR